MESWWFNEKLRTNDTLNHGDLMKNKGLNDTLNHGDLMKNKGLMIQY